MEKKLVEKLVARLGMAYEMERVLDTPKSYRRFEQTLSNLLSSIEKTSPIIRRGQRARKSKDLVLNLYSRDNVPEAVDCFRRYYGVLTPVQTQEQIAVETGISNRTLDAKILRGCPRFNQLGGAKKKAEKKKHSDFYSRLPGIAIVSQNVAFVESVLSQKYKGEIWYGTLE